MNDQPDLFPPNPRDPVTPPRGPRGGSSPEVSARPIAWMSRTEAAVRFLVQLYLGLLVMALPWLGFWTQNNLFTYSPVLMALAESGFVRGAVTGLGLLNIVLAVWGIKPRRALP